MRVFRKEELTVLGPRNGSVLWSVDESGMKVVRNDLCSWVSQTPDWEFCTEFAGWALPGLKVLGGLELASCSWSPEGLRTLKVEEDMAGLVHLVQDWLSNPRYSESVRKVMGELVSVSPAEQDGPEWASEPWCERANWSRRFVQIGNVVPGKLDMLYDSKFETELGCLLLRRENRWYVMGRSMLTFGSIPETLASRFPVLVHHTVSENGGSVNLVETYPSTEWTLERDGDVQDWCEIVDELEEDADGDLLTQLAFRSQPPYLTSWISKGWEYLVLKPLDLPVARRKTEKRVVIRTDVDSAERWMTR